VTRPPFAAIGGQVISDHGPLTLAEARRLVHAYLAEAELASGRWRAICLRRAATLAEAIRESGRWRRAAGWRSPDEADAR